MRLREAYHEPRISFAEWSDGKNVAASILLADKYGLDVDQLYREFSGILASVLEDGPQAKQFAGSKELFEELNRQGKAIHIISSHPQPHLEYEVSAYGLTPYVSTTIGSVTSKVPVIQGVLEQEGAFSNEAVYIGDSVQDMRAAHEADVMAVAVTYGYHSEQLLKAERPEVLVHSLSELHSLII